MSPISRIQVDLFLLKGRRQAGLNIIFYVFESNLPFIEHRAFSPTFGFSVVLLFRDLLIKSFQISADIRHVLQKRRSSRFGPLPNSFTRAAAIFCDLQNTTFSLSLIVDL